MVFRVQSLTIGLDLTWKLVLRSFTQDLFLIWLLLLKSNDHDYARVLPTIFPWFKFITMSRWGNHRIWRSKCFSHFSLQFYFILIFHALLHLLVFFVLGIRHTCTNELWLKVRTNFFFTCFRLQPQVRFFILH